jgi:hypothetical protein
MNNKEKYNYWEEYAQYDIDTAGVMLTTEDIYILYLCANRLLRR